MAEGMVLRGTEAGKRSALRTGHGLWVALPPAPPQLQLVIDQDRALMIIETDARKEAVGALAQILLIAADPVEVHGPLAKADDGGRERGHEPLAKVVET